MSADPQHTAEDCATDDVSAFEQLVFIRHLRAGRKREALAMFKNACFSRNLFEFQAKTNAETIKNMVREMRTLGDRVTEFHRS
jgi:hypothetical protein